MLPVFIKADMRMSGFMAYIRTPHYDHMMGLTRHDLSRTDVYIGGCSLMFGISNHIKRADLDIQ